MQRNTLQPKHPRLRARRVGRGGKRGKTSGRGGKGQTARAGAKLRPEWRDIIKRLPKRRGYGKNRAKTVFSTRVRPVGVTLTAIAERFESGETISPKTLFEKGLIAKSRGRLPGVKILGGTETLAKKFTIEECAVTVPVREAIAKAGGSVK